LNHQLASRFFGHWCGEYHNAQLDASATRASFLMLGT